MSLMSSITRGKQPKPRRLMLYGTHGIGKSSFAACAPNPIFIQTEDGLGDIDCAKFPLATIYDNVRVSLSVLNSEKHDFKTVVIDSLDWLERLIWDYVCTDKGVKNIEEIGYAKGYTFALSHWKDILHELNMLRDKGLSVILLAHSKIEPFQNPETETYDRYSPALHKKSSALVQEWCDEVLFTSSKVFTKTTDEGFDKKRSQGLGTGERIIRTQDRPAHVAKNRLNMKEEIPLLWAEYANYFNGEK